MNEINEESAYVFWDASDDAILEKDKIDNLALLSLLRSRLNFDSCIIKIPKKPCSGSCDFCKSNITSYSGWYCWQCRRWFCELHRMSENHNCKGLSKPPVKEYRELHSDPSAEKKLVLKMLSMVCVLYKFINVYS